MKYAVAFIGKRIQTILLFDSRRYLQNVFVFITVANIVLNQCTRLVLKILFGYLCATGTPTRKYNVMAAT